MKRCVFLSMTDMSNYECYDHLVIPHLEDLDWQVDTLDWHDKSINWDLYDFVIVRSTWDYQEHQEAFLQVLETIEKSKATLLNPIEIMKWNISKIYLKELQQRGIKTIQTEWFEHFELAQVEAAFDQFDCDEIIVKPCISAGSFHTYRLSKADLHLDSDNLAEVFAQCDFMVQPFVEDILSQGEYSLFYFNSQLSHTIVKQPKLGDFRVQEEFGGEIRLIQAESELQKAAEQVLKCIEQELLYVRVDLVKSNEEYLLMELELIEPSLYFNLDPSSAKRFALAVDNYVKRH